MTYKITVEKIAKPPEDRKPEDMEIVEFRLSERKA